MTLQKLKERSAQAAAVYLLAMVWSLRFGEVRWTAYFMECAGRMGVVFIAACRVCEWQESEVVQ